MREALLFLPILFAAVTGPISPVLATGLPPGREAELQRLVHQDCGSCHGLTLKGGIGPDIRAETLEGTPVDVLTEIVMKGVPGTPMPPWHYLLSQEDARWIANYLLNGAKR